MRKIALATFIAALSLLAVSCEKQKQEEPELDPQIKVEVTKIEDNTANVTVSLTQGNFYKVMVVTGVRTSLVEVDYTKEIQLIKYVETSGQTVSSVPYTTTLDKLRADNEYLTAAIAYDKSGRACTSAYHVWTAQGAPSGISDQNDAGKLDENVL